MPSGERSPQPVRSAAHEALTRAEADGDVPRIIAILKSSLWPLLDEDADAVYRAFNLIDPATLATEPSLATVRALCTVMSAPYALAPSAPSSLQAAHASTDPATVHFARMLSLRFRGEFDASRDVADGIRARVTERLATPYAQDTSGFALYLLHAGITTMLAGDLAQAMSDFNAAGALAKTYGATLISYDVLAKTAILHGLNGRISLIDPTLQRLDRHPTDPILRQYTHDSHRMAFALRDVERLDPDARQLVDGLDLLDPVNELWPVVLLLRGRMALAEGTPARVFDEISVALDCHPEPRDGLGADIIRALRIHAFTAMHELPAAFALAEEPPAEPGTFTRLAHMELLASSGRSAEASRAARRALGSATDSAAMRDQALLVAARTGFDQHGSVDTNTALGIHSMVVRDQKLRQLAWLPRPVLDAITGALPQSLRSGFTRAVHDVPLAAEHTPAPDLSPAELRVLRTVHDVRSVARTATRLYVSENTVKTHLSAIYRKLGVHGRDEAIQIATQHGLLGPWSGLDEHESAPQTGTND